MNETECVICKGAKHVDGPDGMVPCECLQGSRWVKRLRMAGVPEAVRTMEWSDIREQYPRLAKATDRFQALSRAWAKRRARVGKVVGVINGDEVYRRTAIGKLMRDCVVAGKSCLVARLNRVVDADFDQEKRPWLVALETVDVLWLQTELVRPHKRNESVVTRLCQTRHDERRATIVSCDDVWESRRAMLGTLGVKFLTDTRCVANLHLGRLADGY